VVAPGLLDVGFDGAAHRTIVIETAAAAMYLEGLRIDEPALNQVLQQLLVLDEGLSSLKALPPD